VTQVSPALAQPLGAGNNTACAILSAFLLAKLKIIAEAKTAKQTNPASAIILCWAEKRETKFLMSIIMFWKLIPIKKIIKTNLLFYFPKDGMECQLWKNQNTEIY